MTRSEQMARIKSSNTKPELTLRTSLWRAGLRYRLRPRLPGTPDLAFLGARVAIFVDGCFWHGCPAHYRPPAANAGYWAEKLLRNTTRDTEVDQRLRQMGWRVLRIWEHNLSDPSFDAVDRIRSLVREAAIEPGGLGPTGPGRA